MTGQRTGEQLFDELRQHKNDFHGIENTLIFDARSELLEGQNAAETDDIKKVAVALWGFQATSCVSDLLFATRELTDVSGQPIIYKTPGVRSPVIRKIHPEFVNPELRSSWLMKVICHDSAQYPSDASDEEKARGFILPNFIGQLLVKTQAEIPDGSDESDVRYDIVWSAKGTLADNNADPNLGLNFSVGGREVTTKILQYNDPELVEEFSRIMGRKSVA